MRARSVAAVVVIILVCGIVLVIGIRHSSASRESELPVGNLLGDQWLRMTHSDKVYFVEGYRRGSTAGQVDACALFGTEAKNHLPPVATSSGIVLDRCEGRARSWSGGSQDVVRQVDEFYTRFPDSRNLHVISLIQNLSDQSGLSLDQIHQMGSNTARP